MQRSIIFTLAAILAATAPANAAMTARDRAVPHYDHVLVIVEENKGYDSILSGADAPNLARFAKEYGSATQMYAERHPSEPNYVAMLGGDTFGISDDDAWYCVPGSTRPFCKDSTKPGYVAHLVDAPNLASQLGAKGLAWRGYMEDIPAPGSLAIISEGSATRPPALYAAKHTGFTNFASVHAGANLAQELVGFDALDADLRSGHLPAFALIVPNQCNEMHGIDSPLAPETCRKSETSLITHGDAYAADLVARIQRSPVWTGRENTAIVITWDENGGADRASGTQSCCVTDAQNPGGGRIPTIVMSNHGVRAVSDPTPYNHYSLLRTIEDALGLDGHLRHADDENVQPMTPLFALR